MEEKKRGRPKLTDEEKIARKKVREKVKEKKKKENERKKERRKGAKASKETAISLVNETKVTTTTADSENLLPRDVVSVIQPVEVDSSALLESLNSNNKEKALDLVSNRMSDLTDKISVLEGQVTGLQGEIRKLETLSDSWEKERINVKKLIQVDEDIIHENEKKLAFIDGQKFQYTADKSLIFRVLGELLTGYPDEILTESRISKHEIKRLNRRQHLINIDGELAQVTITLLVKEEQVKHLESTVSNYRAIRFDLGESFRSIRKLIKQQSVDLQQTELIQNFVRSLQGLNSAGAQLIDFATQTKDSAKSLFLEFDRVQKNMLLSQASENPDSIVQVSNRLETMLDNLQLQNKMK